MILHVYLFVFSQICYSPVLFCMVIMVNAEKCDMVSICGGEMAGHWNESFTFTLNACVEGSRFQSI